MKGDQKNGLSVLPLLFLLMALGVSCRKEQEGASAKNLDQSAQLDQLRLENEKLKQQMTRQPTQDNSLPSLPSQYKTHLSCEKNLSSGVKVLHLDDDPKDLYVVMEKCIDTGNKGQGRYMTFWFDGQKRSEGVFKDGKLDGYVVHFRRDGSPTDKTLWKMGERDFGNSLRINVKLRQAHQEYGKTYLELDVENDTAFFMKYYKIDFDALGQNGQLICRTYANESDIAAGKTLSKQVILDHTRTDEIGKVLIKLESAAIYVGDERFDVEDQFNLSIDNSTNLKIELSKAQRD